MPFLEDFATAVNNYPVDSVTLTIRDVALQTGTAGSINVLEVWKFKVRVENDGQLNMTSVALHLQGQNGALVSTAAAGPFVASLPPFGSLSVNSHGSQDTAYLYFRAPSVPRPAGTQLVSAHISSYNTNLQHLTDGHSDHADPPSGTYSNQVFP